MYNEDLNVIANIKFLQKKAEHWIFEWKIIYLFFVFLFSVCCFYCTTNFAVSLITVFIVFSLLTYKLILIEKHRIKELDEMLKEIIIEKMTDDIFKKQSFGDTDSIDKEILEYLSEISNFTGKNKNLRYKINFLVKVSKTTNDTLEKIYNYDKKNS